MNANQNGKSRVVRIHGMILLLLLLSLSVLVADEGRTPVHQSGSITQPGSYFLTKDLAEPTGPVLVIDSDHVTLDLNGYGVTLNSNTTDDVVEISAGRVGVVVRNGRISGGRHGLKIGDGVAVTVGRIHFIDSFIGLVVVEKARLDVSGCLFRDLGWGITNLEALSHVEGRIAGNRVESLEFTAFWFDSFSGIIRNNRFSNYGLSGGLAQAIQIQPQPNATTEGGILIVDNVIRAGSSGNRGILVKGVDAAMILRNVISGAGEAIFASNDNLRIEGNSISDCAEGIWLDGSNDAVVLDNTVDGASSCGLKFEPGAINTVYRDNILQDTATPLCGDIPAQVDAGGNVF